MRYVFASRIRKPIVELLVGRAARDSILERFIDNKPETTGRWAVSPRGVQKGLPRENHAGETVRAGEEPAAT